VLQVQQRPRVDIQHQVGELSEAVTVTADASTLETSNATIGKVVSNKAIVELPMNSRNVYSLIFLTAGVAGSIGNNYNSMSYPINGATASHPTVQGYTGISAFPSIDAIDEFKVLGSNYAASSFPVQLGQKQLRSPHRLRVSPDGQDDHPRRVGKLLRSIAAAGAWDCVTVRLSDADALGRVGRWYHPERSSEQPVPPRLHDTARIVARAVNASRRQHPGSVA
jgi:hypothetical protein